MQVSAINNQTNFGGAIKIASNINAKTKSSLYKVIEDIDMSNKSYDIFVKNNPDNKNFMSIVAQSSKNPKQNYEVWVHHFMQKAPVLKEALLGAMEKFEQKFDKIL